MNTILLGVVFFTVVILVLVLVLVQLVLGGVVFVTAPPYDAPGGQREIAYIHQSAGHVSAGSLLLAASVFLALRTWRSWKLQNGSGPKS